MTSEEDLHYRFPPDRGNAIRLFEGEWASKLPGMDESGSAALFEDDRIYWMIQQLGLIVNWSVLELGPLEAGNTFMLEREAAKVVAIESNIEAFLKCLVVKNLYGLKAEFLLGDITLGVPETLQPDLIIASGLLYHMNEPIELLQQIAQLAPRVFLWTHFYEDDISKWNPQLIEMIGTKWKPQDVQVRRYNGKDFRLVPQFYGDIANSPGFCGGSGVGSNWMYRDDIIELLHEFGFNKTIESFVHFDHQNGPAFAVLAINESRVTDL